MENKIPLTKQELKNRIGEEGGQVVESQKEYANLVNDNIFGFETIAEYQEFIKLLIEIRTPKLSKDGFKPSIITEIMSNSLRGLSDEDLAAVSESIENMNKTKEQLECLKISEKALKQIITPYENYNKYILFNKAKGYNEKKKEYKRLEKESKELIEKIGFSENMYEELKKKHTEISEQIEVVKYKEKELKNNELWKQKQEQQEKEKELEEIKQNLEIKQKGVEEKKQAIIKRENEKKSVEQNYEMQKDKFNTTINEMEQIAKMINYDEFFFVKDEIKLEKKYNYNSFKEEIKRYIRKLENAKKALEEEKQINNECEKEIQNLDIEKNKKAKQNIETNKARNKFEEDKEIFIENMYKWNKENKLLKLTDETLSLVSNMVQTYGEKVVYDDIISEIRKQYDTNNEEILKEKAILNSKIDNINNEINEKTKQIEEWKNKKEPEPTRNEKVNKSREKLKEKNIPFIEFYNAVDFKKELTDDEKGRIEAALLDMGILDSLIIPKEYREKIKDLDINFIDKYIFEQPIEFKHDISNLLEVKLPQECKIKEEIVFNVLKSIMIEDKSGTYVNEKGEYKIGIIEGIANKQEKAKFIGSEARKEYIRNQIENLEKEINILKEEENTLKTEIANLENKLNKIKDEYGKIPSKSEMESSYNELQENIRRVMIINENVKKLEDTLDLIQERLKQAKEKTKMLTKNFKFTLTVEVYEEILDDANNLKDNIFELEKFHNNCLNEYEKKETIEETLESLEGDLDDILYEIRKLNSKKQTIEGKLKVIEQMSKGMEEIEKQIKEVIKALENLPEEKENIAKEIGKYESDIQKQKDEQIKLNEKIENIRKQVEILKEIFIQEVNLKYVIAEYEEIENAANKVISSYSYFDKENKSKEDYQMNLIDKYRLNNEDLLDYNLSIGQIFVQDVENEFIEIEKTRTRSDITGFINGKRVDLNTLKKYLEESIEETSNLVADEDRNLFEEILIGAVGRKIRERIYFAKNWIDSMNKLMKSLNTSSGLSFSINWKPKTATTEEEMDVRKIVEILNSDSALLRQEEINQVATHFRAKFKQAEREYQEKGETVPFYNIIKDALDYRKWFEFQFMHKKADEQSKELTNNAFYKLSGGEKAMAMYIPLFASVCARYQSARKDCLRIISLDEAFAGVDDRNIRDMFRILTELELEYAINSQVLWGEYDTIPSLSICELISDVNNKVISVMRYHWDGKKRSLEI